MTPAEVHDFQQHAVECYPDECLGVLTTDGYVRLENVANDTEGTAMGGDDFMELYDAGEVLAVCHSHPNGPNCPSGMDMQTQIAFDLPFWIVSTDGQGCLAPFCWGTNERPRLKRRPFQHGVTDCYSLIRDYYWMVHEIDLPEFPRDWEWWAKGDDLYEQGFRKAGFVEIDPGQAAASDVVLFKVRWSRQLEANVTNHGGILLNQSTLLHHVGSREPWDPYSLSSAQPLGRWASRISKVLRYQETRQTLWPSEEALRLAL